MPRYKTLKQIMRQSSCTGADVGKAAILDWIELQLNNTTILDNNELSNLIFKIKNVEKEHATLDSYMSLKNLAQHFQTMLQANMQQYLHGWEGLMSRVKDLQIMSRYCHFFLSSHLTLTEAEYTRIKKKAHRAYEKINWERTLVDSHESYKKTELTDAELVRKYFEDIEPKNKREFMMKHKAQRGIAVYSYLPEDKPFDFDLMNYYMKNNFLDMEEFERVKKPGTYITKYIDPAVNSILGINAFYDIYSEIFKVDLTPLKMERDFQEDFDAYNGSRASVLTLLCNDDLMELPEQAKLYEQNIERIFPVLSLRKYSKEKIVAEVKDALKSETLKTSLDPKYMQLLLQGGSIRI